LHQQIQNINRRNIRLRHIHFKVIIKTQYGSEQISQLFWA
jgi:hypothetical protein